MSVELEKAIESLRTELNKELGRVAEIKKTINQLLGLMGREPEFVDVDFSPVASGVTNIRNDQFFGLSPTSAAREYLRMKGSATTAKEILEGLLRGGFEPPSEWKENNYLKNLAISLKKNSPRDFVWVKSSNAFGLWDFYPEKKREREKSSKEGGKEVEEDVDEPEESMGGGEQTEDKTEPPK